ncbi:MAG: glycosyltransferase involved in cell wall biosynthesis [Flavobacteriaceae bacterium]
MRFSVIIPTINRVKETRLMLDSLLIQTFTDFEVLLIDQNNGDLLNKLVLSYSNKLLVKQIKTTIKGASNARNTGVSHAQGEILLFPDDDCEFHRDYLEEVNSYFNQTLVDGIVTSTKDKEDGKGISRLMSSRAQSITKGNLLKTVIEAGIIVKSSKLNTVLFDPNMGVGSPKTPYWSDEGPDFILRLLEKGLKFNYCPQFYMYHPNPVKTYNKKTALRSYKYGKGRGYFLKKHKYGFSHILFYLFIYVIGMCKGVVFFNKQMFTYFRKGFKGRYEGYFLSK